MSDFPGKRSAIHENRRIGESVSMSSVIVSVALAERSYEIHISTGGLPEAGEFARGRLQPNSGSSMPLAVIVTDAHVETPHAATVRQSLEAAGFATDVVVLDPGEQTKSLSSASVLYDRLAEAAADRRTLIVAVGGGVIGDLAGFVAATYARGIAYLQVPTTLLAQVDSSVGGKVAVNHPKSKNLIGSFYQPCGVLIDTEVLSTLADRDYRCGLAEVVKYGVVLDATFFEYLENHVEEINARDAGVLRTTIARCCELKAMVVRQDEREETGVRAVLNYGHTFAHAFENLADYRLLHGEAVAVGMIYASRLAEALGRIGQDVTQRQISLLESLGLPTELASAYARSMDPIQHIDLPTVDELLSSMRHDKKAVSGSPRFVLPTRLGEVEQIADVAPEAVRDVLTSRSA